MKIAKLKEYQKCFLNNNQNKNTIKNKNNNKNKNNFKNV